LFLPWRAVFLVVSAMLGSLGAVVATQACARVVAMDIGVDTMYSQLFQYDPNEKSVAEMELAGTVEMAAGLGLISIALRCLAMAFYRFKHTMGTAVGFGTMGSAHASMANGIFWEYLPLVRAGLAARIGASLCKVGAVGLAEASLHVGFLTALGVGICMAARAVSILGKYFSQATLAQCLAYTWRPVLAMQFGAYAFLFGKAAIASAQQVQDHPEKAVLFGLCAAAMLAVTCLTAAVPAITWKLGDLLLCYIDAGLFTVIRFLGSLLQKFVLNPLLEWLFFPAVLFLWGMICIFYNKFLGLAVALFAYSFGLLLRPLFSVIVALYSNPFTGLPCSGGLLYALFQLYQVYGKAYLSPNVWFDFVFDYAGVALAFLVHHAWLALKIPVTFAAKQSAVAMAHLGIQTAWMPSMPAVLGGEVFTDLQFAFRVYAIMLLVSIVWRYALDRKPENFYSLFSDLKVPESPDLKQSVAELTRSRPIADVAATDEATKVEKVEKVEKVKKAKKKKNQ